MLTDTLSIQRYRSKSLCGQWLYHYSGGLVNGSSGQLHYCYRGTPLNRSNCQLYYR